jgi:hypothetical protein
VDQEVINPRASSESVTQMRERLEVRRLQIELDKLEKPDTSIDYYSKMLELQEKAFNAQIAMVQKQAELKVEIEKLKIAQEQGSGDFAEEFMYSLMPLLPELLKKQPQQEQKKEVSTEMLNAQQLEEYKLKIRSGAISFEQAYADFKANYPQLVNRLTEDQFKTEFEKIKNGKD